MRPFTFTLADLFIYTPEKGSVLIQSLVSLLTPTMIIPDSDDKTSHDISMSGLPAPVSDSENPPPYSLLPHQGASSSKPAQPLNLPPDLAPTNYLHVKEKHNAVKQKILLDLNLPRPPASALPADPEGEYIPHLTLDSHYSSVAGEVWVLHADSQCPSAQGDTKPARERVRLNFYSQHGAVRAIVHVHPSTVEPRPFLSVEVKAHHGAVTIAIPRSFHGQLTLHTNHGRVHLSSDLAPLAATLSVQNGTHTFFVGERPSSGNWHTGPSGDGDEVDGVIGWSEHGSVRVSYDDELEDTSTCPLAGGVLSSLFKAMGFN